jgi:hypothetical protein
VKAFFLVGSLTAGAAFTIGSTEAAAVVWTALILVGLLLFRFRKSKRMEKAPVPTEYSEIEVREIYAALSLAKSAAPFRPVKLDRVSADRSADV